MNRYALILAGGSGKRLWPLGRQKLPKQLIPFHGDATLLDLTIERMALLVPKEHIWILTVAEYHEIIELQVGNKVGKILIEPEARNTGPAIFYALQQIDPEATLIVTPADHAISDTAGFVNTLEAACDYAQAQRALILCGVKPEYPATGYGYIEHDTGTKAPLILSASEGSVSKEKGQPAIACVLKFHEKPTQEVAQSYLQQDNFLWNTGIFCATVQTLAHEYGLYTAACYEKLAAESIDYMILEKSNNLKVIQAQFDWSDVGTLDLFVAAQHDRQENVVTLNAHNVIVHGTKKLVVVMDVDDICVIETDDVLFITKCNETEKIRNVVDYLKAHGYEEFI